MSEGLPQGWADARLDELIGSDGLFVDGDWVESKDQDPSGEVRLTQLADVGEGAWRNRSARFMNAATAADLGCTMLQVGDVLVARMPDPLGRACMFPGDRLPCVTVVDVAIVRPGEGSVDPRCLMWMLNSPAVRTAVDQRKAGTTRKRISRRNLADIELPIPPLAEQERIVAAIEEAFSRLDAGEASLRTVRQRLTKMRAAVLAAAVTGRLATPSLADDACEWSVRPLGAMLREPLRNGLSAVKADPRTGLPTFSISAVTTGDFSERNIKHTAGDWARAESLWAEPGDVFVQRSNTPELVGTARMYRGSQRVAVFPDLLIRVRTSEGLSPAWLEIVLASPEMRMLVRSRAKGLAGSMPKIAQPDIEAFPIPVPPLPEQHRIVAEVERQMSFIDAAERAVDAGLARSAALRRSVLQAAFSGRLVPQDPTDEPASVLLERIRAERAAAPAAPRRRTKKAEAS